MGGSSTMRGIAGSLGISSTVAIWCHGSYSIARWGLIGDDSMTEQEWQGRYKQEWQGRYMITSLRGKIWKRSELRNRAVKITALLAPEQPPLAIRTAVQIVLDDPEFMQQRTGMIPTRVIDDAGMEAFFRIRHVGRP